MIGFAIPGMYELSHLNFNLLYLLKYKNYYFYPNIKIDAVYGNPQFCIWDGGRVFQQYRHGSIEEISFIIDKYNNEYDIPIRYIFTNPLLKEEHYHDRFCNKIVEIGNNYHNEIVINDNNLMFYLKQIYHNYNFISSTTKCIQKKDLLLQELENENFNLVCLDYNFNSNLDFLKTFTEKQKEKSELLVNAICPPGCHHRKEHYNLNGLSHLNYGKTYKMSYCGIQEYPLTNSVKNYKNNLSYDDITNFYEPLGFQHYKLEGRTWDELTLALTYCYYFIKDEFHDEAITYLLNGEY